MMIRVMIIIVCSVAVNLPCAAAASAAVGGGAAATLPTAGSGFKNPLCFLGRLLTGSKRRGAFAPVASSVATPASLPVSVGGCGAREYLSPVVHHVGATAPCRGGVLSDADTIFILDSIGKLHFVIHNGDAFDLSSFKNDLPMPLTFSADELKLLADRRVFETAGEWIKALSLLMAAEQVKYLSEQGIDPYKTPIKLFRLAYFTYACYDELSRDMDKDTASYSKGVLAKKKLFDDSRALMVDLPPAVKDFLATEVVSSTDI